MLSRVRRLVPSLAVAALVLAAPAFAQAPAAPAGPVIVVETSRGVFEFETYPAEAPKTVARIVELVKQRFYTGQRIHRVVPGFVIQWGDPQTRDMTKKDRWGTGGSDPFDFALLLLVGLSVYTLFSDAVGRAPRLIIDNAN